MREKKKEISSRRTKKGANGSGTPAGNKKLIKSSLFFLKAHYNNANKNRKRETQSNEKMTSTCEAIRDRTYPEDYEITKK
jgi:hypothetical protein